jgi:uncharacterized protein (DUF433 family)
MSAYQPTSYRHIGLDEEGIAWIEEARTKVVEVVLHWQASGLSAEQLHLELPHLSLAQIHSALAYFWDHQEELEGEIARRAAFVETARQESGQPPIAEKLRRLRHGMA